MDEIASVLLLAFVRLAGPPWRRKRVIVGWRHAPSRNFPAAAAAACCCRTMTQRGGDRGRSTSVASSSVSRAWRPRARRASRRRAWRLELRPFWASIDVGEAVARRRATRVDVSRTPALPRR